MSDFERQVTHKALATVARLMGYTPQGLTELCKLGRVDYDWRTIGTTRPSLSKPIERVNARLNASTKRYEFSVGNEAFALSESAVEQQRIRNEVADAVVRRISEARPLVNPKFIKRDQDQQGMPAKDDDHEADALSRPETMIISPVAPRDPRGLEDAERRHSGPRNGMSGH